MRTTSWLFSTGLGLSLGLAGCKVGLEPFAPDALDEDDEEADVDTDADSDADSDSDSDADSDSDTDTDVGDLAIDSISPSSGLNSGGTRVTITGGPFDSSVQATFGGEPAERVGFGSTEIIVETPEYAGSGSVDVRVETDSAFGLAPGGFRYNEDASGKAGAIGEIYWVDGVGNYWDPSPPEGFGGGDVYFVDAADVHWWEVYVSSLDSCLNLYSGSAALPASPVDPGLTNITLESTTGRTIDLSWSASYASYSGELATESDYVRNGNYTLSDMSTSDVPTEAVSNFFKGADDLSVTSPNITGSTPPNVSRSQSFRWSSSVSADWITLQLFLVNSAGTDYDDGIICFAQNDGEFTIPSNAWSSWPTNRQVNIFVGASVEPTGTLTHNGAESRVAGTWLLFGAGFSR